MSWHLLFFWLGPLNRWRVLFISIGLLNVLPLLIIYKKVPAIKEEEKVTLGEQLSILKNPKILTALVITLFYIGGYSGRCKGIEIHNLSRTPVTRSNSSFIRSSWCQSLGIDLGFNDFYVSNLEHFPCSAAVSRCSGTSKSGHCTKRKYFLHPTWFCTGIWIRWACY